MLDGTPLLKLFTRARVARMRRLDPTATQERLLLRLLRAAQHTRFGRAHDFARINSVAEFQSRVPLRRYEEFWRDWWQPFRGRRSPADVETNCAEQVGMQFADTEALGLGKPDQAQERGTPGPGVAERQADPGNVGDRRDDGRQGFIAEARTGEVHPAVGVPGRDRRIEARIPNSARRQADFGYRRGIGRVGVPDRIGVVGEPMGPDDHVLDHGAERDAVQNPSMKGRMGVVFTAVQSDRSVAGLKLEAVPVVRRRGHHTSLHDAGDVG